MADITFSKDGATQRWLVDRNTYERFENNSLVEERTFTADDIAFVALVQAADAVGAGDLMARARTALTTNRVYLDKVQAGTVTQPEHIAEVAALARQVQALIIYTVLHIG